MYYQPQLQQPQFVPQMQPAVVPWVPNVPPPVQMAPAQPLNAQPQQQFSQLRMLNQPLPNSPGNPPVMPYNLTYLTQVGQQTANMVVSDIVTEIQKYAQFSTPRTFAFNVLSANGYNNDDFRNLCQQVITLAELRYLQNGGNYEQVAVNACTEFVRAFMGYLWSTRATNIGVVLSAQDQQNVMEQTRAYNLLCQTLTQMINNYRNQQQQPQVQQQLQNMVTPMTLQQMAFQQNAQQSPSVLGGSYANAVLTPPNNPFHHMAAQQAQQQGAPFLNMSNPAQPQNVYNGYPQAQSPYQPPIQEPIPAWQQAAMVQMNQQQGITNLNSAPAISPAANHAITQQAPAIRPGSKPSASQYALTRYANEEEAVAPSNLQMPVAQQSGLTSRFEPMTYERVVTKADLMDYEAEQRDKLRLAQLVARTQGAEAVTDYVPDVKVQNVPVQPAGQPTVQPVQQVPIQQPEPPKISSLTGLPLNSQHQPLPEVESLPYVSTATVGQKDENGKFKSILSWHQDRLKLAAEAQGKTLGELAPRFIEAEKAHEEMIRQQQAMIQDVSGQGYYEACNNTASPVAQEGATDDWMPDDENPVQESPVPKYNDWSNWYPDSRLPEFAKARLLRLKDEQPEIDYSNMYIHKDVGNVRPKWWDDRVNGIWTNVPYCRMNCDLVPDENDIYRQVLSYNLDYIQKEYFDAMENGKMIEAQHMQPWTIGRPVRSEKEQKAQDALTNVIMVLSDEENTAASIREMNKEVKDTFGNPEYHQATLLDDDMASVMETVEHYDNTAEKKKVVNVHPFVRWRSFATDEDMSSYMRALYDCETFDDVVQWFTEHEGVLPSRLRHHFLVSLTDMANTVLTDVLDMNVTIDSVIEDWFDLIDHLYGRKGSKWTDDVFITTMNERLKGFLHVPNRTVVSAWFEDDSFEDETDKEYFMNLAFTESRICLPDYGYVIRMSVDSSLFDFEESTDKYIRIQRGVTGADPISRVLYEVYKHMDYTNVNGVVVGFKDGRAFQCYRNKYNPQNFKLKEIEL
jgi:hypothetical protein|nr:MAG TPA: hypothetical protein [Caudoviricetes sp.]